MIGCVAGEAFRAENGVFAVIQLGVSGHCNGTMAMRQGKLDGRIGPPDSLLGVCLLVVGACVIGLSITAAGEPRAWKRICGVWDCSTSPGSNDGL